MALPWHRAWNEKWLTGSIRWELTPAERSVWADFLALAGSSDRQGFVEYSYGKGYSRSDLAGRLNIGEELLGAAIGKFMEQERIRILENEVIEVVNWGKYQFTPEGRPKKAVRVEKTVSFIEEVGGADALPRGESEQ